MKKEISIMIGLLLFCGLVIVGSDKITGMGILDNINIKNIFKTPKDAQIKTLSLQDAQQNAQPQNPFCGDGVCSNDEGSQSCSQDCQTPVISELSNCYMKAINPSTGDAGCYPDTCIFVIRSKMDQGDKYAIMDLCDRVSGNTEANAFCC